MNCIYGDQAFIIIMLLQILQSSPTIGTGPILAAVLGALLGSIGTYIVERRNRNEAAKKEIRDLRFSLRSELQELGDAFEVLGEKYENDCLKTDYSHYFDGIPTLIFESNTDKIGLLSVEETIGLMEFYGRLFAAQKLIRETNDPEMEESTTLEHLDGRREQTLELIEQNI